MGYNTNTADDVGRAVKQCPGDLKVLLYKYGEYRSIEKIRTCYVILHKYPSEHEYYDEVSENVKGAIQVLVIE